MTDVVDASVRSRMMAAIRGRDTKPEVLVRRHLFKGGLRFRLHVVSLPGKPDIVLPRFRTVVLVHGCFWHRHAHCPYATTPASRVEFWQAKFEANIARDVRNAKKLTDLGWIVHVIWECEVRNPARLDEWVERICAANAGRSAP